MSDKEKREIIDCFKTLTLLAASQEQRTVIMPVDLCGDIMDILDEGDKSNEEH